MIDSLHLAKETMFQNAIFCVVCAFGIFHY